MQSADDFRHLSVLRLPERSPWRALLRRIALALVLVLAVTALLWFTRDGLRDSAHPDQPPGFVAVLYFTIVSITTVGYGDITPATDQARLINAVLLTPVRIFILLLFRGTAAGDGRSGRLPHLSHRQQDAVGAGRLNRPAGRRGLRIRTRKPHPPAFTGAPQARIISPDG